MPDGYVLTIVSLARTPVRIEVPAPKRGTIRRAIMHAAFYAAIIAAAFAATLWGAQ